MMPQLPVCRTLLAPKLRYGLRSVVAVGNDVGMEPPFDADALPIAGDYFGTVENVVAEVVLIATTLEATATYSVYINGDLASRNTNIANGSASGTIPLRADASTEVVIEVNGTETLRYTLHLDYQAIEPETVIDTDRNGFVDINYLEELAMLSLNSTSSEIGYRLTADDPLQVRGCPNRMCRGYELMRDLDFNDLNSYLSGEINPDWIVPDFATTHTGWTPIGSEETPFAAVFEGNGHIISNLQINRDGEDFQGLFGYIGRVDALGNRSTIRNLGLEDVRIEGGTHVGAMAGDLRGSIVNSYATGSVSGVFNVGGMVGNIGFYAPVIADSRADVANAGIIVNSHNSVAVEVLR